jgi:hypothetical protein
MPKLMIRIREMAGSLGNDGALANVAAEMARTAQARHAVEQLELRVAVAQPPAGPSRVASHAA